MPVIAVLLLAVFFGVMIWFTVSSVRDVAKLAEERRTRSIDQDLVEGRLVRIEEAIDAMAVQIERLTVSIPNVFLWIVFGERIVWLLRLRMQPHFAAES
jgi:hypothetical protein